MSHATIDHSIQEFFRSPRVDRYRIAQLAIQNSSDYDPSAREVLSLESRLSRVGGEDLFPEIQQISAAFQLCPRFHYLQARLSEIHGRMSEMRSAIQRMQLCLRSIAETGDGTKTSPFQITFLSDADDIVRAFGESVRCQQLVASPKGYRDVMTAHSGVEFWFDVESLLEHSSSEASADVFERSVI